MGPIEAARFAVEHGFEGLELHCNPLDLWPGVIAPATLVELAAIAREDGLRYSLYGCGTLNAATSLPELQALNHNTIVRMLDLAEAVRAHVICLHPGTVTELESLERKGVAFDTERFDRTQLVRQGWEHAVAALTRWAGLAAPRGVMLVIENDAHTPHTAAPSAQMLADMVRTVDSPNVRVNFDTGHAFIAGGLEEELEALRPYIAHVHLDDNSTAYSSEHLPLGEGAIDFSAVSNFLSRIEAALVLEIYAPQRPIEATLQSREYLLRLLSRAHHHC